MNLRTFADVISYALNQNIWGISLFLFSQAQYLDISDIMNTESIHS